MFLPEPRIQAPAGAFSGRCWLSPCPFLLELQLPARLLGQPQGDQPASPLVLFSKTVHVLLTRGQVPSPLVLVGHFSALLMLFPTSRPSGLMAGSNPSLFPSQGGTELWHPCVWNIGSLPPALPGVAGRGGTLLSGAPAGQRGDGVGPGWERLLLAVLCPGRDTGWVITRHAIQCSAGTG